MHFMSNKARPLVGNCFSQNMEAKNFNGKWKSKVITLINFSLPLSYVNFRTIFLIPKMIHRLDGIRPYLAAFKCFLKHENSLFHLKVSNWWWRNLIFFFTLLIRKKFTQSLNFDESYETENFQLLFFFVSLCSSHS